MTDTTTIHMADRKQREHTPRSRDEARSPLDEEPPLFCSHEDRWLDRIIVGFLALMLILAAIGLITTLVDLRALLR
ncbi:hypothetical protein FV242_21170 [Methylobacterium sp. WL64]|uniref:hypothetical protein n=2 Tax=Methylobacterium TaxID=407 RepID=UPI0011C1D50B|nr:hypothetical protein [Methylobacterium sp. WL64]QEE41778.1 hypothetical protein FVA80_25390 [Methylobacterium sp. WL1]TXN00686.1 hypothetical protein FV242_21170 [Methylobacterium sp. WL64]